MISAKQFSIDDFKPLTLEDKTFFDEHYKKYPPLHSDNIFTTMISWKEYAHYHYAFIDENLIIMTKENLSAGKHSTGNLEKLFDKHINTI